MPRAWLVALLGLGMALPGDPPSHPTQVPLPVTVQDARGRPVSTLTAVDFQVSDRGVPVEVVDASWVPDRPVTSPADAAPATDAVAVTEAEESAAARTSGTRVLALFLDEYHVTPDQTASVQAALGAALREFVHPADLVLTVKPLDPLMSLVFHRGNTAALAAVASFEGRLGDYVARNAFERDLIAADPARIDRARTRIAFSAIQAIATRLTRLGPSRKAMLVVGEPLGVTRPPTGRPGEGLPSSDGLLRLAMRSNVSISTLDPRRGEAIPRTAPDTEPTMLADLVRQTDGRALRADDSAGLRAWLGELGGYYLLTISGGDDGEFHPLTVRTARPGMRVRTRAGYWAVSREELARLAEANAPPPPPRPVLPPVRRSRLIVPWVGQTRASDGRTRLSFVWEPAPARAGERSRVLPPSRLVLTAQLPDGTSVFEGTVQAASAGIGVVSEAHFDVPPGRLRLQMSIEDVSARVLDTEVRDVVVAAMTGDLSLGTPRVFRTRTAREFAAVRSDLDASPVASRTFSRVERLLMRVPVYLGDTPVPATEVNVSAALRNRGGQVMRALPVTPDTGSAFVAVDLPLAGLAAGEYSVQWRAVRGSTEVIETVPFRLVP